MPCPAGEKGAQTRNESAIHGATSNPAPLDPRSNQLRRAFSALAVLLAVYGAAGCEPSEPHWRHFCRESHTQSKTVYWPNDGGAGFGITPYGAGVHLGGGLHVVQETVCDRTDSTWVVPDSARTVRP